MNTEEAAVEQEVEPSVISDETKENYRIWKKNSLYLYDYLQTSALLWPSLTVQWFPDVERNEFKNTSTYRLLTGTFTSGNYTESLKISDTTIRDLSNLASVDKYDLETQEFSAIDREKALFKKITNVQDILHNGEINRAVYLPQKPDLISTINNNGDIYVFDRTKHPLNIRSNSIDNFKPQITLKYHETEGFGLNWNLQREGELLSCSLDGNVALWDITKYKSSDAILSPSCKFADAHTGGVNDVKWVPLHDSLFVTGGEDQCIKLWDTRQSPETQAHSTKTDCEVTCLSGNPDNMFCVASGESNGNIKIWDTRDLSVPVHTVNNAHKGLITVIEWNLRQPKVLASGGQDDRFVKIWDFGKIKSPEIDLHKDKNQEELLFVHGGHMLGINDLSWNPHDDWLISSVANDNSLHVWKPALASK